MKTTLSRVEARAAEVQRHPFLLWLADGTVPARRRLSAWLPEAAFFVFGFRDLNAEVLRYPEAEAILCPRKRAINQHLAEDATHWPWYLQDLRTLGLDRTLSLGEALRFLWGNDTAAQRRAVYRMCALAERAQAPAQRYALIAALEAVAHRLFGQLVPLAREFQQDTGKPLVYLGPKHFERETGHLTHQTGEAEALFQALELDPVERAIAMQAAEEVVSLIEARWSEFHRVALAGAADTATARPPVSETALSARV